MSPKQRNNKARTPSPPPVPEGPRVIQLSQPTTAKATTAISFSAVAQRSAKPPERAEAPNPQPPTRSPRSTNAVARPETPPVPSPPRPEPATSTLEEVPRTLRRTRATDTPDAVVVRPSSPTPTSTAPIAWEAIVVQLPQDLSYDPNMNVQFGWPTAAGSTRHEEELRLAQAKIEELQASHKALQETLRQRDHQIADLQREARAREAAARSRQQHPPPQQLPPSHEPVPSHTHHPHQHLQQHGVPHRMPFPDAAYFPSHNFQLPQYTRGAVPMSGFSSHYSGGQSHNSSAPQTQHHQPHQHQTHDGRYHPRYHRGGQA